MDPRERIADTHEAVRVALDGHQARLWTGLPGVIQSYDAAAQTVTVQPAVMGVTAGSDVLLPVLADVPVQFPSGGGLTMTFPVAAGDECWLAFGSRCIDGWWAQGGVQKALTSRMHDLSDAVALLGIRSQPRVLANVSTTSAQVRTDDGQNVVDVGVSGVTLKAGASTVAITSGEVAITSATLTHNGKNIGSTHAHTDVESGSSDTGPPA
ncbi:MAG: Gp138 family membrane-puncturing spike protein [Janthinobacterium lividum]